MKIVLDANLLISAYTCEGEVRKHYLHDLELVEICISPEILIEVERNLRRKEFDLGASEVAVILRNIVDRCQVIRISSKSDLSVLHGSDWHIYALADQIGADCVVTGDKGFFEEAAMQGIPCKRLSEFVAMHKATSESSPKGE